MRLSALIAFAAVAGCGGAECVIPPCAFPIAIVLNVRSAAGVTIGNASVEYTVGGHTQSMPCNGTCYIGGALGKYDLTVTAPGYTTNSTSVTITGRDYGKCSCMSPDQQTVDVKLSPV
jgi:hypothetical protein